MQFGIGVIYLQTENSPGIQKQDRSFLFPYGFYHLRASGQTARCEIASGIARLNVPHYRAGVKDRDTSVIFGKRGGGKKNAEQQRQK